MCMLLGMSKQLVYAFPGFYNKETIVLTQIIFQNVFEFLEEKEPQGNKAKTGELFKMA